MKPGLTLRSIPIHTALTFTATASHLKRNQRAGTSGLRHAVSTSLFHSHNGWNMRRSGRNWKVTRHTSLLHCTCTRLLLRLDLLIIIAHRVPDIPSAPPHLRQDHLTITKDRLTRFRKAPLSFPLALHLYQPLPSLTGSFCLNNVTLCFVMMLAR
jgi:hypothetical protein